jgi:hypothetical protein
LRACRNNSPLSRDQAIRDPRKINEGLRVIGGYGAIGRARCRSNLKIMSATRFTDPADVSEEGSVMTRHSDVVVQDRNSLGNSIDEFLAPTAADVVGQFNTNEKLGQRDSANCNVSLIGQQVVGICRPSL